MPMPSAHPYVYHLVQARLWDPVAASGGTYYPPSYDADGFTHATANPATLMKVANHFYREVDGKWYCLRMTQDSLAATGVQTLWEGAAPVGDVEPGLEGSNGELFPHLLGGITPAAVLEVLPVERTDDGGFLRVPGITP